MRTASERDLSQVLPLRSELVHVADGVERQPVRGRHRTEGDHPLREARDRARPRSDTDPAAGALRRRLRDRPVDEHVATETGGDGERAEHHRRHLRRSLTPGAVPAELEPEGVLHLRRARSREAGRARPHGTRVAGETVDVRRREARVGNRAERGLAGEVEVGAEEAPADL